MHEQYIYNMSLILSMRFGLDRVLRSERLGSTRIDSDGLRSGRVATGSDITTRMDEGRGSWLSQHEIIVCCFTRFVLLCIAHCA